MHKLIVSGTDRRNFLHFGILAGLGLIAGCSEGGSETVVAAPPAKGGARENLKKYGKKAEGPPSKKAE